MIQYFRTQFQFVNCVCTRRKITVNNFNDRKKLQIRNNDYDDSVLSAPSTPDKKLQILSFQYAHATNSSAPELAVQLLFLFWLHHRVARAFIGRIGLRQNFGKNHTWYSEKCAIRIKLGL